MIKVLFVCLGNICRSPMAEAVFRHILKQEDLEDKIEVASAGTGSWHIGKKPHQGTRQILDQKQITYEGIVAQQLKAEDVEQYDYIIAMDTQNVSEIKKLTAISTHTYLTRLLDLCPDEITKDVPDPYFTGNFEEVYQLVHKGCINLLKMIRERNNI